MSLPSDISNQHERIHGYDVIRGFSVISMVLFHFCYDLAYIKGLPLAWFVGTPLQAIWRASISWVFLLLAGIMCVYSRNNFKRAGKYLLVALLVWLITSIAMPNEAISFGIIYCMGASTLIAAGITQAFKQFKIDISTRQYRLASILLFLLFILSLQVPWGSFGLAAFGGPSIAVSQALYNGWMNWLGFMSQDFFSADYYPLIPYTLLFLSGTCMGHTFKNTHVPNWLRSLSCKPLEFIGHYALEIYILHQPVLLAITYLI